MNCLSLLSIDFGIGANANKYTRKLVKTTLIRMSLPPRERSLKVQWLILFSNIFKIQCQSLIPYPRGFKKYPRYLKPIMIGSILKGIKLEMPFKISSSTPLNKKKDFSTLIHMPEAELNTASISSKSFHSSSVLTPKSTTLSTKKRCVRTRLDDILMHLINPFLCASLLSKLSPSIIKRKRMGGKGETLFDTPRSNEKTKRSTID